MILFPSESNKTKNERERKVKKILIADENMELAELMEVALKNAYEIKIVTENWKEALDKEPFDLVITNLLRSDCSVVSLINTVKEKRFGRDCRVLIITGYPANFVQDSLPKTKADGILHKPFLPQELRDAVEKILADEATG